MEEFFESNVPRKIPFDYEQFGHTQKLTQSTSTTKEMIANREHGAHTSERPTINGMSTLLLQTAIQQLESI